MNHEQASRILQEYYDRELDDANMRDVELHCQECSVCAGTLEAWRRLHAVIRDAAVADLSPAFVNELRESVLTDRDASGVWLAVEPLARRTVLAIAIAVALFTSIFWTSGEEVTVQGGHAIVIVPTDSAASLELLRPNELTKADVLLAALSE